MKQIIYAVEDEPAIQELYTYSLENDFECRCFESGEPFFCELKRVSPDLILLDIMLPGDDGFTILSRLKSDGVTAHIPVIMVSAKGEEIAKVKGLNMGADDYIAKPFGVMELIARINANLRKSVRNGSGESGERSGTASSGVSGGNVSNGDSVGNTSSSNIAGNANITGSSNIAGNASSASIVGSSTTHSSTNTTATKSTVYKDVVIDHPKHRIFVNGQQIQTTLKEYNLLCLLCENAETVQEREKIFSEVWGDSFIGETRTLDIHIKELRKKLANAGSLALIQTIRGVGYMLTAASPSQEGNV